MKDCKRCDLSNYCADKEANVCVKDLKPGDIITFYDSCGRMQWENQKVAGVYPGAIEFENGVGINIIFVTQINLVFRQSFPQ